MLQKINSKIICNQVPVFLIDVVYLYKRRQSINIQCGAKEMSVVFSKDLFGENEVTPTPQEHGDDHYILQCEIGTCDIPHFIENNKYGNSNQ